MTQQRPGPTDAFVDGNLFDKYRSKNPLHRVLMERFLTTIVDLYEVAEPTHVLEIGCGPGDLANSIKERTANWGAYLGTDISEKQVKIAQDRYPVLNFVQASAEALPFKDNSYDLVIACEVLEHLDNPSMALAECARLTQKWLLISVPWEPYWRILNCFRGKYWSSLGNTPGHVQHFSRRSLMKMVEPVGKVSNFRMPFPWLAALIDCERIQEHPIQCAESRLVS